jgi:hypothetical protein
MTRIVTTVHRYKPPPRKRKAVAIAGPVLRTEQAAEPDDDPEADAAMRAWLERAKWGHGPAG